MSSSRNHWEAISVVLVREVNIRCEESEKGKLKNTQDFCFSSLLYLQLLPELKLLMCIGLGIAGEA